MKEFLSSPAFLLSFSPTGKYLAVGTTQSSVILFSTDSGTPVHVLQLRHLVNAVAMLWESPYELVLACSDKRVLILHLSGDVRVFYFDSCGMRADRTHRWPSSQVSTGFPIAAVGR